MEAAGLAIFMVAAGAFASLIHHPGSPVRQAVADPVMRRVLMGLAMGSTAIGLIYSPLGARSGAHINPATTLTFLRLGRIHPTDAAGYVVAQFAGGLLGIGAAALLFSPWLASPTVNYVATLPGPWGGGVAFAAEMVITFLLMTVVLHLSNHARLSRYTGLCVGLMVATYITVEDPFSGMSMNPARSLGPALLAGRADTLWIYFLAPPLGMLLAAEAYLRTTGIHRVFCAKLHHHTNARCIFNCRFDELAASRVAKAGGAPTSPLSIAHTPSNHR
jgi:aquaporin Z